MISRRPRTLYFKERGSNRAPAIRSAAATSLRTAGNVSEMIWARARGCFKDLYGVCRQPSLSLDNPATQRSYKVALKDHGLRLTHPASLLFA